MKKNPYNSYNNRRHKTLPPEDIVPNEWHSFTYNPETQPVTPRFTLDLITWHNGMDNLFKSLNYCDITLRPEISSGSRWHYHGQIKISNVIKFYIFDLPILRDAGSLEIDTITDIKIWTEYCVKQKHIMNDLCIEYGIPYYYEKTKIMKVKIQPLNDSKFTELIKLCPTSDYIDE